MHGDRLRVVDAFHFADVALGVAFVLQLGAPFPEDQLTLNVLERLLNAPTVGAPLPSPVALDDRWRVF